MSAPLILREKILIRASPEKIWGWIAHPAQIGKWNPKLQGVEPLTQGNPRLGYAFHATYTMSGKSRETISEIVEFQPFSRWSTCHRIRNPLPSDEGCRGTETYTLTPETNGTRLLQEISLQHPRLNLFFRLLIKFIHTFGKPTGPSYLQELKKLAENS